MKKLLTFVGLFALGISSAIVWKVFAQPRVVKAQYSPICETFEADNNIQCGEGSGDGQCGFGSFDATAYAGTGEGTYTSEMRSVPCSGSSCPNETAPTKIDNSLYCCDRDNDGHQGSHPGQDITV